MSDSIILSPKMQLISATVAAVVFVGTVAMIKKGKLDLNFSLIWLAIAATFVPLTLFPDLSRAIAASLGIGLPVNALFFIGILFAVVFLFGVTVGLTRHSRKIRRLTQQLAILESVVESSRHG